ATCTPPGIGPNGRSAASGERSRPLYTRTTPGAVALPMMTSANPSLLTSPTATRTPPVVTPNGASTARSAPLGPSRTNTNPPGTPPVPDTRAVSVTSEPANAEPADDWRATVGVGAALGGVPVPPATGVAPSAAAAFTRPPLAVTVLSPATGSTLLKSRPIAWE